MKSCCRWFGAGTADWRFGLFGPLQTIRRRSILPSGGKQRQSPIQRVGGSVPTKGFTGPPPQPACRRSQLVAPYYGLPQGAGRRQIRMRAVCPRCPVSSLLPPRIRPLNVGIWLGRAAV